MGYITRVFLGVFDDTLSFGVTNRQKLFICGNIWQERVRYGRRMATRKIEI